MNLPNNALSDLLRSEPGIWLGWRAASAYGSSLSSGFAELDRQLLGGGWPLGALLEIQTPCLGVGELKLLLPAMAALSQRGRWIVWVAPPHQVYAPALAQAGIDLSRVLLVQSRQAQDIPWTLEKLLRHKQCGMALAWPKNLLPQQTRRLQLAAEQGGNLAVLFTQRRQTHSYAALRLAVQPLPQGLSVHILKARGSLSRTSLNLNLAG